MLERMHAVVQQAFGGPEVLEVAEVDRPVPLATEVLVRVKAVGVNPVEPLIRSGQFPLIGQPPFICGNLINLRASRARRREQAS
jgi:NADPH:quinone reductase-like Zn-dependent oxidoreductase